DSLAGGGDLRGSRKAQHRGHDKGEKGGIRFHGVLLLLQDRTVPASPHPPVQGGINPAGISMSRQNGCRRECRRARVGVAPLRASASGPACESLVPGAYCPPAWAKPYFAS